jgi:sec-independent protein translocase protein TatB
MFEISWSELLILGIVTLIFVGPKELPVFLRTLGRYGGIVKQQVGEVRAQFNVVMREAELDQMRKEVEGVKASVSAEMTGAKRMIDGSNVAPNRAIRPETPQGSTEAQPEHRVQPASDTRRAAMPPMPAPPLMEL